MQRNNGLAILAGVTLVTIVAAAWSVSERYSTVALEQKEGGLVFPDLQEKVGEISTVEIVRADGNFVLQRRPEGWANMGVGGYPARQTRIEKMIGGLVSLSYFEPKTERSSLYSKIGVEDVSGDAKSTRLRVNDEAGTVVADVIVGKAKSGVAGLDRDGVYVRLPGEQRAWLAESSLDVRYDAVDWSERRVVHVRASKVGVMSVTHPDGELVEIYRKGEDDADLTVKNLPQNAEIEHQYQIDFMSNLLDEVSFLDAKLADQVDFEKVEGYSVTVVSTNGLVVMLRTGLPERDESIWAQFDAAVAKDFEATEEAVKEAKRIKTELANWAFRLPRSKTDRLKIRLDEIIKVEKSS
jgi:hypothetical protein